MDKQQIVSHWLPISAYLFKMIGICFGRHIFSPTEPGLIIATLVFYTILL